MADKTDPHQFVRDPSEYEFVIPVKHAHALSDEMRRHGKEGNRHVITFEQMRAQAQLDFEKRLQRDAGIGWGILSFVVGMAFGAAVAIAIFCLLI